MKQVARVCVEWDGKSLIVSTRLAEGWNALTGSTGFPVQPTTFDVRTIDDLTAFELETMLYAQMRELGARWEDARRLKLL